MYNVFVYGLLRGDISSPLKFNEVQNEKQKSV